MSYIVNFFCSAMLVVPELIIAIAIIAWGIWFLYSRKAKYYTYIGYIVSLLFIFRIIILYVESSRHAYSGYCLLFALLSSIPCFAKFKRWKLPNDFPWLSILFPAIIGPLPFFLFLDSFNISPTVNGPFSTFPIPGDLLRIFNTDLLHVIFLWYPRSIILSACMNLWLVSIPKKFNVLAIILGFLAPILVTTVFLLSVKYIVPLHPYIIMY